MTRAGNDTKQKLIDTAKEMIWQSSYGSVSVDHICKAADVKKGSFYHYFPSKAHLAVEVLDQDYAIWKPLYDEAFSAVVPPVERFKRMVELVCKKQRDAVAKYGRVCGCPYATLGSELVGQEDAINKKIEEIFACQQRYCETTLRDMIAEGLLPTDTDIKAKTNEIYTFIMGQSMMARIQNSLDSLERNIKSGLFNIINIQQLEKV